VIDGWPIGRTVAGASSTPPTFSPSRPRASRHADGAPRQPLRRGPRRRNCKQVTHARAFAALKAAFAEHNIKRVPPGTPGADIIFEVIHNSKIAAMIIIEVKNEKNWGWSWPAKLEQNKEGRWR
jgi:hypothetical protein